MLVPSSFRKTRNKVNLPGLTTLTGLGVAIDNIVLAPAIHLYALRQSKRQTYLRRDGPPPGPGIAICCGRGFLDQGGQVDLYSECSWKEVYRTRLIVMIPGFWVGSG